MAYFVSATCRYALALLLLLVLLPFPITSEFLHPAKADGVQDSCDATEEGVECGEEVKTTKSILASALSQSILQERFMYTIITFKNAKHNNNLQDKFRLTVSSLLSKSSIAIVFLIIGDTESQTIAKSILSLTIKEHHITTVYQVIDMDAEMMAHELHAVVEPMQRYFSSKPGSYYSDSLFFLSIAIHRILPDSIERVIMLDADLKFKSDILDLYQLFDQFPPHAILGIARENQPVYRHTFSYYRSTNRGTRVGDPPPNGLTGFNSGVLLLNLKAMRESMLYNSLINEATLTRLSEKYKFKGHLGDQDFFTLISTEHEELFYMLPCGWNRQLCTWWRDNGYADVFSQYYDCPEPVHIYHGNCNTRIPDDAH